MKKIALILIFIFGLTLQSCSPKLMPRVVSTSFFDYRKYANEGFFLSPDPYTGDFTPCGELSIVIKPADVKFGMNEKFDSDSKFDLIYNNNSNTQFSQIAKERISTDELLDIAVKKAKEVGANGIANFKCLVVNHTYFVNGIANTIFSHYEISGYAIMINKQINI